MKGSKLREPPRSLSVIIPTLNEEQAIVGTLESLQQVSNVFEVIVADGGSSDRTRELATKLGARVITAPRGRGSQLRLGAAEATGDALWFLHADTQPLEDVWPAIRDGLTSPTVVAGSCVLSFDGPGSSARFLTWLYPRLSMLGLCYGDAGLCVLRENYERIGGFRDHPLFEDLDLVRRLRRHGRVVRIPARIVTSSRRFEGRNFGFVFAGWTALQVLFWLGVPTSRLARFYPLIRAAKTKRTGSSMLKTGAPL